MVSLFFNKVRPIGLDIGHNSVKMMQIANAANKWKIVAADEKYIDPVDDKAQKTERIVEAIKDIMDKGQFRGREVITCLPNVLTEIKNFKIDLSSDSKDIEQRIYKEAENKFGLTRQDYDINYIVVGNTRAGGDVKMEVIIFSAAKKAIEEHIKLIEAAGLVPVSIDTVPTALFRSYVKNLRREEDTQQISLVVDFGSSYTTLVIGKGNQISFIKQIPLAGIHLNSKVASKLDITVEEAGIMRKRMLTDDAEKYDESTRQVMIDAMSSVIEHLTREISLCFKYFTVTFRGDRPEKIYCSGGEAYEVLLIKSLRENLHADIDLARPLRGMDIGIEPFKNDRRRDWCEWAIPVGLSVKGMN